MGDMPDAYLWRQLVQARDVEAAIEQMAAGGLGFWVGGLSRRPGSAEIERHCEQRLVAMTEFVGGLLPDDWRNVAGWLEQLPLVLQMRRMLAPANPDPGPERDLPADSNLGALVALPAEERRRAVLETSPLGIYLSDEQAPETLWLRRFSSRLPELARQERALMERLIRLLQRHGRKQEQLRRSVRGGAQESTGGSWALREELFHKLRLLFAGDPFNAMLVLVYGLMELIQFERVRGVLLMQTFGWSNSDLSGGVA